MTTTHPTIDTVSALRASICAAPEDDTLRLVYADALDEAGDGEWAEFVRVGVELARVPPFHFPSECDLPITHPRYGQCEKCKRWSEKMESLSRRSDALLRSLEPRLRRGRQCERCLTGKKLRQGFDPRHPEEHIYNCPICSGRGWLGVLGERKDSLLVRAGYQGDWLIPATFSRGLVSGITCTMEWWMRNGERVVKEWPVTEARLNDVPITECGPNHWIVDDNHTLIPTYGELRESIRKRGQRDFSFPTEAAARAALSDASLAWARGQG